MNKISIVTKFYYDRPEYYPFMPASIFNALEEAELKGAITGEDITADVPEDDFRKMIEDYTNYHKNLTNGSKNSQAESPGDSK